MPWYSQARPKKLTNAAAFGKPGSNGTVKRIVMHSCGLGKDAAQKHPDQAGSAWNTWNSNSTESFHVSAHFCIELDGRIVQFIDTDDIAYGTGWLTSGSVHIEHAGGADLEMTPQQLPASANLLAWIKTQHPDVELELTGKSYAEPGDPEKAGVTAHRFIQEVYHKRWPDKPLEWRSCPGTGIVGQMPLVVSMARNLAIAAAAGASPQPAAAPAP